MKILLDNCIPGKTGKLLQEAGFVIITLKELGKSSASNSEVLYLAKTNEALLLTCDLDFSNILIYTLQALIAARVTFKAHQILHASSELLTFVLDWANLYAP